MDAPRVHDIVWLTNLLRVGNHYFKFRSLSWERNQILWIKKVETMSLKSEIMQNHGYNTLNHRAGPSQSHAITSPTNETASRTSRIFVLRNNRVGGITRWAAFPRLPIRHSLCEYNMSSCLSVIHLDTQNGDRFLKYRNVWSTTVGSS